MFGGGGQSYQPFCMRFTRRDIISEFCPVIIHWCLDGLVLLVFLVHSFLYSTLSYALLGKIVVGFCFSDSVCWHCFEHMEFGAWGIFKFSSVSWHLEMHIPMVYT
jgi:hypothetical protein